jgi:PPP family 3-phenylpropionic acid transporter
MLKLFYVCLFVASGVSIPFFPPYLRQLGLSGREVATLMAVAPVLHLGAPLLWGWAADRTRRPDLLLRVACLGAGVCLVPLVSLRALPAMLPVYAAHQLFAVATLGLADSLAVDRARRLGEDYGRTRLWGSISFVAACTLAGPVLLARGRAEGDPLVPLTIAAAFLLSSVAALALRGEAGAPRPHARDLRLLLRDRRFLFLLVVAPLHWACLSPYHGFFAILVHDRGHGADVIGLAFAVSVIAEIVAFYFFRHLRRRFSLPFLLAFAMAASAARWLMVSVSFSAPALVAGQLLHALSFGVFWSAAVAWLGECVPPALRATGQTLYTAVTFGVGHLVGVLGSGLLYDATGGASAAFATAAGLELIPLALTLAAGWRLATPPAGVAASSR